MPLQHEPAGLSTDSTWVMIGEGKGSYLAITDRKREYPKGRSMQKAGVLSRVDTATSFRAQLHIGSYRSNSKQRAGLPHTSSSHAPKVA